MGALANGTTCRTGKVRLMGAWKGVCLHLGIFCLGLLLAGCGGGGGSGGSETPPPRTADKITISGTATTENGPLNGAAVAISKLDITQTSETKSRRGKIVSVDIGNFQPTVGADGVFSFQIETNLLQDETLYSLSVTCPKPVTDICLLQAPLHAVLSGKRLKQAVFSVNVLTEVIYQRLGYYIAAGFKASELQLEMDALARMLLKGNIYDEQGIDYNDLVWWKPEDPSLLQALKRPHAASKLSDALLKQQGQTELQLEVQSLFSPIAANLQLEGGASLIAIEGNYAYVIGSSGLRTIDISEPLQPLRQATKVDILGKAQDIKLVFPYIYIIYSSAVETGKSGLQIVDISTPDKPVSAGKIELSGSVQSIDTADAIAYITYWTNSGGPIADKPSGLHLVSISNPNLPSLVAELNLDNPDTDSDNILSCGVATYNNYAYVTDIAGLVHIIDVSNPENPQKVNDVQINSHSCAIMVSNRYAYISTQYNGLSVMSLENLKHPTLSTEVQVNSLSRRMAITENRVYIAGAESGVNVIDIDNPSTATLIDNVDTPGSSIDVALSGNFIFVTDENKGVQIIDIITQPPPPVIGNISAGGVDIAINNEHAYVLSYWPWLRILDIAKITEPRIAGTIEDGRIHPHAISYDNDHLFIVHSNAFEIYQVGESSDPTFISAVKTPGWASGVAIAGDFALVADGSEGMQVFDISEPLAPTLKSVYPTSDFAINVTANSQFAFVAVGSRGMDIIDMSRSVEDNPIGRVNSNGTTNSIFVVGNTAYLADGFAGLQIIDISDPTNPYLVGRVDTPGNALKVVVANAVAYVADDYAGVQVIDVQDRAHPIFIGSARTRTGAMGITAQGNYVYVTTHYGLEIFPAIPTE